MKRSVILLGAAMVGLALFGWGCAKSRTSEVGSRTGRERPATNTATVDKNTNDNQQAQVDGTPVEPVPLAYLQLTQGARATVSRDGESTDAANDMELYAGDTVEVLVGEVNLLYPAAGVSFIEAPAKFTVLPDEDAGEDGLGTRLLLEAGKVWTRLEKLLGKEESFSVEASDVVATVRGTAFGVAVADGNIDVQVAESQVKVIGKTRLNTGAFVSSSVLIAAGNAVRLNPTEFDKTANLRALMQRQIRKLTATDKQDLGYVFAMRKFDPGRLVKPARPFRWAVPPALDSLRSRLQTAQLQRWERFVAWMQANRNELERAQAQLRLEQVPVRFMPPLRQVLESEMATPTTTPQILKTPNLELLNVTPSGPSS